MKLSWIVLGLVLVYFARELLIDDTAAAGVAMSQNTLQNTSQITPQPRVAPKAVNRNAVRAQLHRVRTALHQYNLQSGEVPAGLDELIRFGLLQSGDIEDPWGREFAFRSEKKASVNPFVQEYEIFVSSSGADGIQDNQDDIYL